MAVLHLNQDHPSTMRTHLLAILLAFIGLSQAQGQHCCQGFEAAFTFEHANNPLGLIVHNTSSGEWTTVGWNFGDGQTGSGPNADHLYAEPGLYQVCVVIENNQGCRSELCRDIAVNIDGNPCGEFVADFSHQVNLENLTASFTNLSPDSQFHIWHFGDGSTSNDSSPEHEYDEPGVYQVCLVVEQGDCRSEYCREVCVEDLNPCAEFEVGFSSVLSQVSPLQVNFNGDYTGNMDAIVWHFGDGTSSNAEHPEHVYAEPGTYEVCLVGENEQGCRSEVCRTITVGEQPEPCQNFEAGFTFSHANNPLGIIFDNNSTGEWSFIVWNFGDGETADGLNPDHLYDAPGLYEVCVVIENEAGCRSEFCQNVPVNIDTDPCNGFMADFTYEAQEGGLTFHFNNTSTTDAPWHIWHFGDGSASEDGSPTHTYEEPGTYNVCLVIESENCRSEHCMTITVGQEIDPCHNFEAGFTFAPANNPMGIIFTNTSTGEWTDISWTFGDFATSDNANPDHHYAGSGLYEVCLWIGNGQGCGSEFCMNVPVNIQEDPCTGFVADFAHEAAQGGLTVHFSDISEVESQFHIWHFGDGSVSDDSNPSHTYAEPGIYQVCMVLENDICRSEYCISIVVGELPDPCLGFEAGFAYEVNLSEGGIHFQNLSSDGATSFHWNFGDGSMSDDATPVHEFVATGLQNVCLRVENEAGCVAEFCMNVHVPVYYFHMVNPLAVDPIADGEEHGLELFPNPFTDVVQFATTAACQVEVMDMQGRMVFSKGAVLGGSIDLGTLSSGLYLLRTTAPDGTVRTARAVKR
jgi:PKD repeat protein